MKFYSLNSRLPKRTLLITAGVLYLLSFFTAFYFQDDPSVERERNQLEHYVQKTESDFNSVLKNVTLLEQMVQQKLPEESFTRLLTKEYGLFLYDVNAQNPLYWNSQSSLPPLKLLQARDGNYFQQLPNGYYVILKRNVTIANKSYRAFALVPILYKYDYEHSSYLRTEFVHNKEAVNKIVISTQRTNYVIRSANTQALFYIAPKAYVPGGRVDSLTGLLRLLSFVLLLGYIHFIVESFTRKKGAFRGIVLLLVLLFAVRLILMLFPALFSFRQFALFDPKIYANYYNLLSGSLGDLLINAVLFCWLVVFTWFQIGSRRVSIPLRGNRLYAAGVVGVFLLIFSTFQFANVVRSLVADSKISFNVIDFFSLDVYTVVGFIVLALLSLSFYYFTRILYRFIFPAFAAQPLYLYFVMAFIGLLFLTFRSGNNIILFHLPVLFWLVFYTLLVSRETFIINRFKITIAGILFWIFVFSISLACIILGQNKEKEFQFRKAMAEKYDQLTDPSGELTLNIALAYLDNDYLKQNLPRFEDKEQNHILRDSIISANVAGYLNKYETKLFVFNAANQPVNNPDPATYAELNNLFTVQSKPTGNPDLSYYETSYDQFTYITKRVIRDSANTLGTFFVITTPRRYNTDALYPELFRRINETDAENSPIYSYAIYQKGLLVSSSSKYSFRISLMGRDIPQQEYERRIAGDYDELWYKASTNKVVVIAKKRDTLLESITLFSYLFCAFLFLVGIIQAITLLLKAGNDWKGFGVFWHMSIRSQVHSTITFISVLSFLVIGVATISFFIARYNRNNIDKLSRTASIVVREMQKRPAAGKDPDSSLLFSDSASSTNIQRLVNEIADIHNVDVNLYDPAGNLQVSSEPEVYKRGLLSTKIHPAAYYHLNQLREVQYVQEEALSSLKYLSIYAAIRNEKGQVYAYLNIPYFLSQIDVNQEISNFLVTLINLNAFIFLIAGIIALIITNRITRSFSIIGDKMRDIQLGKPNEEIEWVRNDEIGELVKQYNKMVQQLEESALALAKSEREGAWREMARQVAHEIKNPLTPMKLSIQYLQRAIHTNQPNVQELTTNVANTLIEQIDHLSKISSDFARFANIANSQLEVFDLHLVIEGLIALHNTNSKVQLTWNKLQKPLLVHADKTHMNRLFTNLIANAIEACSSLPLCQIEINETKVNGVLRMEIKDNGEGIPEETRDKIFTPNFTTKSSGTGLGLAMCKSIVEQAGGAIWFQTETGRGSSFFVQLPLAE